MPHIFGDARPHLSNSNQDKQAFSVITILVKIPDGDWMVSIQSAISSSACFAPLYILMSVRFVATDVVQCKTQRETQSK